MSREQLDKHFKEFFFILLLVMVSTAAYLFNIASYKQNQLLDKELNLVKIVEDLEAEDFTDYLDYFVIAPTNLNPAPGDEIWHKGDRVIKKGGFAIEWVEHIECDFTPHDEREHFTYYVKLITTTKLYTDTKPRTDPIDYKNAKGFPSYTAGSNYIAKYPHMEADCRLVSDMVQHHSYGVTKKKTYYGEIAKVRLK